MKTKEHKKVCIMDKKRSFIVVEGIVQGVGFRPFVYNLAKDLRLKGWVMIIEALKDKMNGLSAKVIASKFQNTIVSLTVHICIRIREDSGINEITLSGGVFQKSFLSQKNCCNLEKDNFKVYTHKDLPSNDGGVAIGQIIIVNELIEKRQ